MKIQSNNRIAGLSLMEAIVVIGIMTVILFMVTEIMILNYNLFESQVRRSENETGAIITTKTISQMTRSATSIESTHLFGGDTHTSSSSTLVLKLPAIDANDNILEGIFDYVAFYRDDTDTDKIMAVTDGDALSVRPDNTRLITANNQSLTFRYNDPTISEADRVSIYILNQQSYRNSTLKSRGWTSVFLRNQ